LKKISFPLAATAVAVMAAVSLTGCSSDTPAPKPTTTTSTTVVDGAEDFPKAIEASISKSLTSGLTVVGTDGLDNTVESAFDPSREPGKNVVIHTTKPENLFYPDAAVYGDGKSGALVLGDMKNAASELKTKIEFDKSVNEFRFASNDGQISYKIRVKDNLVVSIDALILGEKNTARALHFDVTYALTDLGKGLFK
jgi:hypothetical protein